MYDPMKVAADQEARRMRLAGMKPDGTPLDTKKSDDGQDPPDEQDPPDGQDPPDVQDPPDDLAARLAALQADHDALQGRVAPAQQEAARTRALWLEAETQRQSEKNGFESRIQELERQLEERQASADVNPADVLSEDELKDLDPGVLNAVQKLAKAIAAKAAPKIDVQAEVNKSFQQRELEKIKNHRTIVLTDPNRGLHLLSQKLQDPTFKAWYENDENILESVMSSLFNATSTESIDRYAKVAASKLREFDASQKKDPAALNPKTALDKHMRREPIRKLSDTETKAKLAEANRLSRSRSPADRVKAGQIIEELEAQA